MFVLDSTHRSRHLACAGASAAGSMLSGQWGAAPGTSPARIVRPVNGFRVLFFSVTFFPRRKVFQRNTCECLKGRKMMAKAKRRGYQCSEAVRIGCVHEQMEGRSEEKKEG